MKASNITSVLRTNPGWRFWSNLATSLLDYVVSHRKAIKNAIGDYPVANKGSLMDYARESGLEKKLVDYGYNLVNRLREDLGYLSNIAGRLYKGENNPENQHVYHALRQKAYNTINRLFSPKIGTYGKNNDGRYISDVVRGSAYNIGNPSSYQARLSNVVQDEEDAKKKMFYRNLFKRAVEMVIEVKAHGKGVLDKMISSYFTVKEAAHGRRLMKDYEDLFKGKAPYASDVVYRTPYQKIYA